MMSLILLSVVLLRCVHSQSQDPLSLTNCTSATDSSCRIMVYECVDSFCSSTAQSLEYCLDGNTCSSLCASTKSVLCDTLSASSELLNSPFAYSKMSIACENRLEWCVVTNANVPSTSTSTVVMITADDDRNRTDEFDTFVPNSDGESLIIRLDRDTLLMLIVVVVITFVCCLVCCVARSFWTHTKQLNMVQQTSNQSEDDDTAAMTITGISGMDDDADDQETLKYNTDEQDTRETTTDVDTRTLTGTTYKHKHKQKQKHYHIRISGDAAEPPRQPQSRHQHRQHRSMQQKMDRHLTMTQVTQHRRPRLKHFDTEPYAHGQAQTHAHAQGHAAHAHDSCVHCTHCSHRHDIHDHRQNNRYGYRRAHAHDDDEDEHDHRLAMAMNDTYPVDSLEVHQDSHELHDRRLHSGHTHEHEHSLDSSELQPHIINDDDESYMHSLTLAQHERAAGVGVGQQQLLQLPQQQQVPVVNARVHAPIIMNVTNYNVLSNPFQVDSVRTQLTHASYDNSNCNNDSVRVQVTPRSRLDVDTDDAYDVDGNLSVPHSHDQHSTRTAVVHSSRHTFDNLDPHLHLHVHQHDEMLSHTQSIDISTLKLSVTPHGDNDGDADDDGDGDADTAVDGGGGGNGRSGGGGDGGSGGGRSGDTNTSAKFRRQRNLHAQATHDRDDKPQVAMEHTSQDVLSMDAMDSLTSRQALALAQHEYGATATTSGDFPELLSLHLHGHFSHHKTNCNDGAQTPNTGKSSTDTETFHWKDNQRSMEHHVLMPALDELSQSSVHDSVNHNTSSMHYTQQMNVVIDNTRELNLTLGSSISSIQSVYSAHHHHLQQKMKKGKGKGRGAGVKILDPSHPGQKIHLHHQHTHLQTQAMDDATSSQSQSKVSSTTTTLLDYRSSDEDLLQQPSFTP